MNRGHIHNSTEWRWAAGVLTILVLGLCPPPTEAGEKVLFEETFDHYGVRAPGFHERCRTREWPPSQKFMAFEPEEDGRMFVESRRVPPGDPGWKDYELRFRFRFFGDSRKHFDVEILAGSSDGSGEDRVFSFGYADTYRLSAPGGKATPAGNATLATPLLNNQWYDGWIRARGGQLTAWLDNGATTELGTIGMQGLSARGFNVRTDTKVMFDFFRIVELGEKVVGTGANPDVCLRREIPELARPESAMKVAAADETQTLEIGSEANQASAFVRVGDAGEMKISLTWADDSKTAIDVKVGGQDCQKPVIKDGKQTKEKVMLPDALLHFRGGGLNLQRHVRPDITRYEQLDLLRIVQAWTNLPSASHHFTKFEVRLDTEGAEYWVDERYAGRTDNATRLKALAFALAAGGAIKDERVETIERDPEFLVLDAAAIACPGMMGTATLSVDPGRRELQGVPFEVVGGAHSVDVGVVQEHRGSWALECDLYLSRTAFSGVPDTLRLSVPVAQYNRAYVLCAVEEDPAKVPILTTRLTHFKPGSLVGVGPAIATTVTELPRAGGPVASGISEVGTVQVDAGGKSHAVPLYLIEVPLDVGPLQDLQFQREVPYLDIDLIGKPRQSTQQWKLSDKPDILTQSAVHVFGLTLAKSPVAMVVMPKQVGNVYYPDEKPGMSVSLRALEAKSCVLRWDISDVSGAQLETQTRDVRFARAGDQETVDIDFSQEEIGWYKVTFALTDEAGLTLLRHTASFARQPIDTRQAGYESPYYSWWFGGAHGTIRDMDIFGSLMKRAGIRRTNLKSEEQAAGHILTGAYLHGVERLYDKDDPAGSTEKMIETIRANREKFPHLDHALIYHESCSGPFPMELLGKKPALTDAQAAYGQRKSETARFVAKIYREHFPDVKLVIGNSGNAVGGLAHLFRDGYPVELIDFMGEESACQTIAPEKNEAIGATAYTFWMLRELALKFGYKDLQPVACHERNYRSYRSLGPAKAAAWTVRDALIVHAWRSPLVPIMGPEDVPYCYANSVWGDFGMFSRNPQTYPRPGFCAMSTLTRVLDGAVFRAQLATGSLTAYALEFARGEERIYPLWAARGDVEMTLAFTDDTTVTVTDLWGRETKRKTAAKALAVKTGTEPVYVTVSVKATGIAVGTRTFPDDAVPAGVTVTVANGMQNADEWDVIGTVDPRIDNPGEHGDYPPFRQPGEYRLRQVADPERGDCLELELIQQGEIPTIMHEYAFLKLKTPAPVPGSPTTVGVWVKGNSGWGQLMWEYEDAKGEKWLSCGTGGYGCNVYDWPGQASISFDGWNFVQFPITQESPIRVESPGGVLNEWQRDGNGDGRLDYPIKLTGIMLSMQRKAINLTRMDAVKTVIRLQDLSAY